MSVVRHCDLVRQYLQEAICCPGTGTPTPWVEWLRKAGGASVVLGTALTLASCSGTTGSRDTTGAGGGTGGTSSFAGGTGGVTVGVGGIDGGGMLAAYGVVMVDAGLGGTSSTGGATGEAGASAVAGAGGEAGASPSGSGGGGPASHPLYAIPF